MAKRNIMPYLACSELTGCVYIVLDKKGSKIDVTSQFEFIEQIRKKNNIRRENNNAE